MQDWISSSGSGQNCGLVFTNGGLGFGWISSIQPLKDGQAIPGFDLWDEDALKTILHMHFLVKMNSTTKSWEIRRLIDFLQEKPFVSCQNSKKSRASHLIFRRCAAFSGDFPTTKSWFERLEAEGRNLPSLKLTGNIAPENGWSWNTIINFPFGGV